MMYLLRLLIIVGAIIIASESFVFENSEDGAACVTIDGLRGVCMSFPHTQCNNSKNEWAAKLITPKFCDVENGTICCNRKSEENCLKYKQHFSRREGAGTAIAYNYIPIEQGEFPYMASLGWTQSDGHVDYRCGGVLISENFVLTAAHCTSFNKIASDVIRIGGTNSTEPQIFGVAEIIRHPDVKRVQNSFRNDIALVKLTKSIELSRDIHPVCLRSVANLTTSNVTALGFELSEGNSQVVLKVSNSIVLQSECLSFFETIGNEVDIVDTQICIEDPWCKRSCRVLNSGPVFDLVSDPPRLVGFTSFGIRGKSLTVSSRISSYVDWIESIVWK